MPAAHVTEGWLPFFTSSFYIEEKMAGRKGTQLRTVSQVTGVWTWGPR
jgi:hypothetical protein